MFSKKNVASAAPKRKFRVLSKKYTMILCVSSILLFLQNARAHSEEVLNESPSHATPSVSVNSGYGSVFKSISINVPNGRGGIQPDVSLNYSSSAKQEVLGVGWFLALGHIERSTKRGVPEYDDTDTYLFARQELIFDVSTGYYRSKIEDGFSKIEKLGSEWVITDKSGTKYYFGSTDDSKQYDVNQPSNVFKWFLSKVEDLHGNYMSLAYVKDGVNNQIYPQSIAYTGYQTTEVPFAEVEFILENRYTPHFSYNSGFPIKTVKRVKKIVIKANNITQREYELIYSQSQATKKDLLIQVKQYAGNGIDALPSFNFDYINGDKGFVNDTASWNIPTDVTFSDVSNSNIRDLGVRIVDVDSDGYQDFLVFKGDGSSQTRKVYINDRNKSWNLNGAWSLPNVCSGIFCTNFMHVRNGACSLDMGLRVVDLNGDGRMDLTLHTDGLFVDLCNTYNVDRNESYINASNGWSSNNSNWLLPSNAEIQKYAFQYCPGMPLVSGKFTYFGTVLNDVNNDGYTDAIRSHFLNNSPAQYAFLNNMRTGGSGWSSDTNWIPPSPAYNDFTDGAQLVDLNGDGLPEIFYRKGGVSKTYINTARNWKEDASSPWDNTLGYGDLTDGSTQFGDVNGDGLADMIIANGSSNRVLINTGNGWWQDDSWALPGGNFLNLGTRLLDADSDGMLDFMIYYNGQAPQMYVNKGKFADLLYNVDNNVGGSFSIVYDSSTRYSNEFLPFPFPVASSITNADALTGDSYETKYFYASGLWNAQDREFRGFGYVRVEGSEGNYTETEYLQGDYTKGRIVEQRTLDKDGKLFGKTTYQWSDAQEIAPGSKFVYLERKDNYVYDGGLLSKGKRTAEQFFYEENPQYQHGNLIKVVQLGEVDISTGNDILGDSRTIETQYVKNETIYLIGLPSLTTVKDNAGNVVRQTWFNYDGLDNGVSPNNKGLLTKKTGWAGGLPAKNPVTTFIYDAYGNLETTTIPKGNVTQDPLDYMTTITYDSTYHIFPVETKNPLNYSVINEYYGINEIVESGYTGLWGQLKSTTDPNQETGKRTYNTFGDLVATVSPLDSIDFPTQTKNIEYFSDYIRITTHQRINHGQPETIEAVTFIDGLGRTIQTKLISGNAGQYIVSGQVEYNSRGLPEKKYLNRFTFNGLIVMDAIDPAEPYVSLVYDSMGRVAQTTNPNGSHSSVSYNHWTTETINENGHKQESDYDAYGRLIEKREYLGADGRGAPTYPDTGNYTLYATTRYAYDSEGNLIQTQDAHGNVTTVTYDNLGRKISMNDPDMGVWSYEYDLNGNLTKQTDAKSQVIDFTYDKLNRLVNKTDGGSLDVDYTYDDPSVTHSKGRLTQAQYSGGDTEFKYDSIGREIESIKKINSQSFGVERKYDALNELLDIQYPDGEKIFYKYNAAGQIEAISNDPALFIGPQSFNRMESDQRWKIFSDIKDGLQLIAQGFLDVFIVKEAYAQTVDDIIIDNTQAE
ncbi:MAG: VCBS repeat-containing protein, partial [Candidatus Omnitrophica bacterium]|nr:VCBS repeat-containing protein [Candidatus Omnitrophota bacterium]